MFFRLVVGFVLGFIFWSLTTLLINYLKARRIGLPIVVSPWDAINPLWFSMKDSVHPILMKLPFGLTSFFARHQANWTFVDRYEHHARYGPAFTEVSPGSLRIFFADPVTMEDFSKRRNDFIKPPEFYSTLEPFGPNLDTVNGKIWERHRKITVPPFNEKNSALVWQSTLDQATQMLNKWQARDVVSSTQSDVNALALNVLFVAGYGVDYKFMDERKGNEKSADGSAPLGYRESLRLLLKEFVPMVLHTILIKAGYPPQYMWGSLPTITKAKAEFKAYTEELVANERMLYEQGNFNRHNLLSTLIRADIEAKDNPSEEINERTGTTTTTMNGLVDEEIYGNLFIYALAGHDTTASTIQFAVILLAINPELQEWVGAEIDAVRKLSHDTGDTDLFYESMFTKLPRCLALMYETLRLYGPVQVMPRKTPSESSYPLRVGDRTYVIPPSTYVHANFSGIHTNPNTWAPDQLRYRPQRFISSAGTESKTYQVGSDIFTPASTPASFVAWNYGPRVCPGRKFSQVEFVATLFVLFADGSRVQVKRKGQETEIQARERAKEYVQSATLGATLKLPGDIDVTWTRK